jgi:hypothetical protein
MSDLQEIRDRLRGRDLPEPDSGDSSIATLLLLAACGIAIGFAALWLMPYDYSFSLSSLLNRMRAFWR